MKAGYVLLIVALGLTGIACGNAPSEGDDVLYLRSGGSVAAIAPGASAPSYEQRNGVPSGDWSTVVHTRRQQDSTVVIASDPETGDTKWTEEIPGRLVANVVSHDGTMVALSPARERYYRYGRRATTFVIVGRWTGREKTITVPGNFEPEAFSADGKHLFVVSYLPARAPSEYQVRRLDLTTGTVEGVFTPHDELQDRMGGTARIQATSVDGTRLYTLYTVSEGGQKQAFIHVLDLVNLWAHCIDLPEGFAQRAEWSTALAVTPDGSRVYAANTSSEVLAEIDAGSLTITRQASLDFPTLGRTHAAVDDDTLYVTSGPWVSAIDTESLDEKKRWSLNENVNGVQVSKDGNSIYVGVKQEIVTLNLTTGSKKSINPPGIGRVGRLGPAVETVDESPIIKCAC